MATFSTILDLVQAFPTEQACIDHLEKLRWNGNVVSPFDSTSQVYKCAGNKYKCKSTGKYFNVKVGTIFEDTKIPLKKWFMSLYLFSSHKKGISSHQLAKDIGVTQKTAWFMLHRLRYAFNHPNFTRMLNNTVEIDEAYIGGEGKYKHNNKKVKNLKGNTINDKTPVLGMIERDGIVKANVIDNTKDSTIYPIIRANVEPLTNIITDEFKVYDSLNRIYNHRSVNHSAKQYVNGMVHTNSIENFWSHLKRGIDGINHWVSKEHLQRYVTEYTLRFNTSDISTSNRFDLILTNSIGRLTYNKLISNE